MVVFVLAAVATAWFTIRPSAAAKHQTPVALAPASDARPADQPRRHRAGRGGIDEAHRLQAVADVATGDRGALAAAQPDYTWIAGNQPSTDSHTVSVAQNPGNVVIAVAASNHDVCAFGKWAPNARPVYVTMAHEQTCAAVNAPSIGWSPQAGGAESDLPDDNG